MLLSLYQLNLDAVVGPPTLSSASIAADGDSITLVFSEAVTFGAGGNGGLALTATGGGDIDSYVSGDTTDTLVYSTDTTIDYGESITLAYIQPTDGIEANDDNEDVASFSGVVVTNASVINRPAVTGVVTRFRRR